jgi:hypothetical protein
VRISQELYLLNVEPYIRFLRYFLLLSIAVGLVLLSLVVHFSSFILLVRCNGYIGTIEQDGGK